MHSLRVASYKYIVTFELLGSLGLPCSKKFRAGRVAQGIPANPVAQK